MKHFVLALMLLTSSVVATATSIDFTNQGGLLVGSSSGLTMSGSTLVAVFSTSLVTGNLGTISFSTSSLVSGSVLTGGTFAPGGTFNIIGNGTGGLPNAVIFAGTFDSGPIWTMITLSNGTHNYTLTGTLSGTFYTGNSTQGVTVQLTINTGKGFFNGATLVSSGDTNFITGPKTGVVPEPTSLMLMGTGLVTLAGKFRKKLVA